MQTINILAAKDLKRALAIISEISDVCLVHITDGFLTICVTSKGASQYAEYVCPIITASEPFIITKLSVKCVAFLDAIKKCADGELLTLGWSPDGQTLKLLYLHPRPTESDIAILDEYEGKSFDVASIHGTSILLETKELAECVEALGQVGSNVILRATPELFFLSVQADVGAGGRKITPTMKEYRPLSDHQRAEYRSQWLADLIDLKGAYDIVELSFLNDGVCTIKAANTETKTHYHAAIAPLARLE